MKVAMLVDPGNADGTVGGAELTMQEFALAAPEDVEWVTADADVFIIGNCTTVPKEAIETFGDRPVFRYFNDVDPHSDPELRAWFLANATTIFTSPLHVERFPFKVENPVLIPPPVGLEAFRPSRQIRRNQKRSGNVTVGAFQNPGKGAQALTEWADVSGGLTVYGTGQFLPYGPNVDYKGPLDYKQVPSVLWSHKTFVHLPTVTEPFGRGVVEAWAAGCELVVNGNVGATHWIQNDPDALATAATDFWSLIRA